ncbi:MAG TPA: bifunctional DNA-formamidopyrimidine glycosylase/DNA-(apurinic or apyrimidinic site) lyase [Gemmatimonadales bacterium]|nr:bifunctional DNA-formamidopyrimidine glycosylase/DNA-(apurinic or apyrimidinic site) lyase [Gemmatimonadales bacterium]
MPELPEVETIVRELRPRLVNRTIARPRLHATDVLRGVSRRRLLATLRANRVLDVARRAKHVVVRLASGHRLIIQPGMTGSVIVYRRRVPADQHGYAVLEAALGDGRTLLYRDVRRLGTVLLLDDAGWQSYTARIGPEPLAGDFDLARFTACLHGTRQAIKKVLMDQRRIAGVGNIYANEALFRARIDPSLPAHRLTPAARRRLFRAVRVILREAVRHRGTTVRDYRTGTGERGEHQDALAVYGRGGEPCLRCGARLATTHAIDGRSTTFCYRCQGGA